MKRRKPDEARISGPFLLDVHVQPNAKRSEVVGMHGDALKIKIKAVPEDGKANAELCAFLAQELSLAKSQVSVVRGMTSRQKTVAIEGKTKSEVELALRYKSAD